MTHWAISLAVRNAGRQSQFELGSFAQAAVHLKGSAESRRDAAGNGQKSAMGASSSMTNMRLPMSGLRAK
jgi:hypothetical protein